MRSQHPLAQAVVRAAQSRRLAVAPADQLTSHLGKGLVARVDGATVEIGTAELYRQLGIAIPPAGVETMERFSRDACTAMLVRSGTSWGVTAAADRLRPAAPSVVQELKRLGIRSVVLISGDSPHTLAAIAGRASVDRHHGALLPEQKVEIVG